LLLLLDDDDDLFLVEFLLATGEGSGAECNEEEEDDDDDDSESLMVNVVSAKDSDGGIVVGNGVHCFSQLEWKQEKRSKGFSVFVFLIIDGWLVRF
jgi:hypothetical protein